jgi:hypothetical protein
MKIFVYPKNLPGKMAIKPDFHVKMEKLIYAILKRVVKSIQHIMMMSKIMGLVSGQTIIILKW